jgi:hypothetical protein
MTDGFYFPGMTLALHLGGSTSNLGLLMPGDLLRLFNLIWAVQSHLQKYFGFSPTPNHI